MFDRFEGYLGYGIGISDRNGFRVIELRNPTRLVIDIAHDLPAPTATAPQTWNTAGFRVLQLRSPDRIVVDIAH